MDGDVYAAGYYIIRDDDDILHFCACYWKNGVKTDLPGADSSANAIAVVGTDVYAAGSCGEHACYWKNGVKTNLYPGDMAYSTTISVSGTDVYILGNYITAIPASPPSTAYTGCYWKVSGTELARTDLPAINAHSVARAIAVAGTDVYIAGSHNTTVRIEPYYWKSGDKELLRLPIPPNTRHGGAYAIAIAANRDVYIAGEYYSNTEGFPCYWKNSMRKDLPIPKNTKGSTSAIAISGSDVYITGDYEDHGLLKACYWKNGIRTDIDNGYTYDICVVPA